ncbi:MAG: sigma-70 family RNA polymerase sigma factor [Planctomycetota bacterium]
MDHFSNDEQMRNLIAKARDGCAESQNELLSGLRSYLLFVAENKMESKLRAKAGKSDAVQQTMMQVAQKLGDFRGDNRAQLFAWVREILDNEVKQIRRSYQTEKRNVAREVAVEPDNSHEAGIDLSAQLLTPQSAALLKEETQAIQAAIASLPEDYRQVIELRNWQKLSFAEIGKEMDRSENAVTKLWFRALVRLEQVMGESSE